MPGGRHKSQSAPAKATRPHQVGGICTAKRHSEAQAQQGAWGGSLCSPEEGEEAEEAGAKPAAGCQPQGDSQAARAGWPAAHAEPGGGTARARQGRSRKAQGHEV
eukprot:jgi/Astpho2/2396/gw1.00044.99.1_t